ncbi:unnamed protein product, partial [Urochloa humidicola]
STRILPPPPDSGPPATDEPPHPATTAPDPSCCGPTRGGGVGSGPCVPTARRRRRIQAARAQRTAEVTDPGGTGPACGGGDGSGRRGPNARRRRRIRAAEPCVLRGRRAAGSGAASPRPWAPEEKGGGWLQVLRGYASARPLAFGATRVGGDRPLHAAARAAVSTRGGILPRRPPPRSTTRRQ